VTEIDDIYFPSCTIVQNDDDDDWDDDLYLLLCSAGLSDRNLPSCLVL
jgi:hypothetical protein